MDRMNNKMTAFGLLSSMNWGILFCMGKNGYIQLSFRRLGGWCLLLSWILVTRKPRSSRLFIISSAFNHDAPTSLSFLQRLDPGIPLPSR